MKKKDKIKIIKRKQIKKKKYRKIEWKVSKFHQKKAKLLWR